MTTIREIKFLLYTAYAKGVLRLIFYWVINPGALTQVGIETKAIADIDSDIKKMKELMKQLISFNASVDKRLFLNPVLASNEERQQAAQNQLDIEQIRKALRMLKKERFEQLIFALR